MLKPFKRMMDHTLGFPKWTYEHYSLVKKKSKFDKILLSSLIKKNPTESRLPHQFLPQSFTRRIPTLALCPLSLWTQWHCPQGIYGDMVYIFTHHTEIRLIWIWKHRPQSRFFFGAKNVNGMTGKGRMLIKVSNMTTKIGGPEFLFWENVLAHALVVKVWVCDGASFCPGSIY